MQINKMYKTLLFLIVAQTHALELTPETWDSALAGKTAFVKFFAPWCGHCKRMKPDWDKLMEKYEDSTTVVVADVDCINDGKPLCDKVGVKGFPTVKYGSLGNLEDYKGGRDFDSLDSFAQDLQPPCNIDTLEHCSDEEKTLIDTLKEKSEDELQDLVTNELDERTSIEKTFETDVKKLQQQYQDLQKQKETDLISLKKKYNIGVVKSILQQPKTEL